MSNLVLGLILGLYAGIGIVVSLSGLAINNMLWAATLAGALCGNVGKGFEIGASCLMMSLGFFTYGGATIPDYTVGAMFGTVVAIRSNSFEGGILVATGIALLMSEMDILGRATTTTFQHLAEGALAKNDSKKFEMWTVLGMLPWLLSRMIPVLIGMVCIDGITHVTDFANSVEWLANGLGIVGAALPAIGFALLLSYIDIKTYWPFLLIGYALLAFLNVNTIALAIIGLALGALFMDNYGGAR